MANHPSAEKRNRQRIKRTDRNRAAKSAVRTLVKRVRTAIAAKRPSRTLAITDGTAVSGMPAGSHGAIGGRPIVAGSEMAMLEDGTIAGSVVTMDRVFQMLTGPVGLSLVDAATMCSTTPARELGLVGHGLLAPDAAADLVVLDATFTVVQTYVGGNLVYSRNTPSPRLV